MTFAYIPGTQLALYEGNCLDVLKLFPDASVDSVVTDPPYGLSKEPDMAEVMRHWLNGDDYEHTGNGFMGKSWDSFVPGPSVWRECLRVLKPGGHLLSFAGSRTQDLMGLAIRLAGFEIRDSIAWLYGSGFPKSLDVSKAIDKAAGAEREVVGPGQYSGRGRRTDNKVYGKAAQQWQGWGTALKPAFEPIVVARKSLTGTVAANVLEHGTGALNIDACRVQYQSDADRDQARVPQPSFGVKGQDEGTYNFRSGEGRSGDRFDPSKGRWPTNVVLDETQAAELDKQTGDRPSSFRLSRGHQGGDFGWKAGNTPGFADDGGASRFFPVFKYQAKAPTKERPKVDGVAHPTVKPLELMLWLVKLVTPPEGVVLDPFAGSGTTLEAALLEGFSAVGIEAEPTYLPLIKSRIEKRFPELGELPA